jgi:hypothetical protein
VANAVQDNNWGVRTPASPPQLTCPWLGLERDAATHAQRPTSAHRCYRDPKKAFSVSEDHQVGFCLAAEHAACPAFERGWRIIEARNGKKALPRAISHPRNPAAKRPLWLLGSLVLSSLVIFLVSYVALVGLKSGSRAIETDAPGAEPSASTSAAVTAVAPTPTPEPSPTVAATATPQRSYTVQSGDSYAAIAQRFGTTAERLVELNKRTLDSPLHPNDVLLLP